MTRRSPQRGLLAIIAVLVFGGAWLALRGSPREGRAAPVEEPSKLRASPPPASLEDAESGAAETRRVAAGAELPAGSSPATDTQDGHLTVHVLAREDNAPLAGIQVVLRLPRAEWRRSGSASHGRAGQTLKTDAQGRVEVAVPPGRDYVLAVARGKGDRAAGLVQDVAPFTPGERRDLVVQLATALDLVWFARVVDGETGRPLVGARAWRLEGSPFTDVHGPAAESDAAGIVQLSSASWSASYARVEQPGYAAGTTSIEPGHGEPAAACTVLLFRAAELEVSVSDAVGAPRAGLSVVLTCWAWDLIQDRSSMEYLAELPSWAEITDDLGRCTLGELPVRVPLTIELVDGADLVLRQERSVRMEPGERKELRFVLGKGCRVQGRTLDAEGRPQAGVEVWLVSGGGSLYLQGGDVDGLVSKATSDAQGDFVLENVAAGSWRIGPAPRARARGVLPGSREPEAIAPVAQELVIGPDQALARVSLTCWRGLYIDGRVVGPGGERVQGGVVSAVGEGITVMNGASGDGFVLGPLPAGSFQVSTYAMVGSFAAAEPVTVPAGTRDLVLRMRQGGSIAVRVRDSRGNPASGIMVYVLDEAAPERIFGMFTDGEGELSVGGRLPGSYTISASSHDGEFGCARGLEVLSSGVPAPVELHLEPAARLNIRVLPELPKTAGVRILQGGRPLGFGLLAGDPIVVVPEGELELVLWLGTPPGEELQRRTVRAVRGTETEVVFGLTRR